MSQWPSFQLKSKSYDYQELEQPDGGHEKAKFAFGGTPILVSAIFGRIRGLVKDSRSNISIMAAACICAAVTLTIIVSAVLISSHHSRPHYGELSPPARKLCGSTAAEARAAGCTWDQLMWAWYPPNCPHYANEDFIAADDWKFFSDPWGTEITETEWEAGLNNERRLFSRHGEHLTHCLYFFLSVGQVVRDGTPATPKLRNYDHLNHCVKMLLPIVRDNANYSMINTKTPAVSYGEYC